MLDPESTLIAKSTLTLEPHLWLLKCAKQAGDNLFLESKAERDQTKDSTTEPHYPHTDNIITQRRSDWQALNQAHTDTGTGKLQGLILFRASGLYAFFMRVDKCNISPHQTFIFIYGNAAGECCRHSNLGIFGSSVIQLTLRNLMPWRMLLQALYPHTEMV